MESGLTTLGRRGVNFVSKMGGITLMLTRFLGSLKEIHRSVGLIFEQLYTLGVKSLPLIVIISVFVGAVSAWQAAYQFKFIGAPLRYLGQAVGKAVVIELAPVLSAIVFAGRVGAGITAELGTMRVTEQIDALDTLATNPFKYLVAPRLIAGVTMLPILVLVADAIGVFGGYVVSIFKLGFNPGNYIKNTMDFVETMDVVSGLVKAGVFGFLITLMGCYHGYNSKGGAQGVGTATTNAVVSASMLIFCFNYFITEIFFAR